MKDELTHLLKRYVAIFLKEYQSYLNKDQLDLLNNIDYSKIIKPTDLTFPIGIIYFNQIYISKNIINIPYKKSYAQNMWINNKNYEDYLSLLNKYGCNTYDYYANQLMFLLFKLVINNDNGLINGFINGEVNYLTNKYHFRQANLYIREKRISDRVVSILKRENVLKIMFMDRPSSFKYLNDNLGYHYAYFYDEIQNIVNKEYQKINLYDYNMQNGIIKYAYDYDHLLYGNAYNYLFDFNVNNNHI